MTGTTCAYVELKASVGRLRDQKPAAYVERENAHLGASPEKLIAAVLGDLENGVDDRVVAEVWPVVIHVQNGDINLVLFRCRNGVGQTYVFEEILIQMDGSISHRDDPLSRIMPCFRRQSAEGRRRMG